MEKKYSKNVIEIPDISLVMVYKISPFLQAHRGNVQKIPIQHQFTEKARQTEKTKEKEESEKKKEKSIADSRK